MGARLPILGRSAFSARLSAVQLPEGSLVLLHQHYQELCRWNPATSLVGPGTAQNAPERHYLESLAGLAHLPEGARVLIDVGSGAGFPGWILAAARPELEVHLFEPRLRKAAFLRAAAQRAGLRLWVSDARLEVPLPREVPLRFDALTMRAVRLETATWEALLDRLAPGGRVLRWVGPSSGPNGDEETEPPAPTRLPGLERRAEVALPPGLHGFLLVDEKPR